MSHASVTGRFRFLLLCLVVQLAVVSQLAWAQDTGAASTNDAVDGLSAEEARQVQIAERFLTVLERNPRRGTALDRIYGHHIEFGTLDEFLGRLQKRVEDKPDDGVGWMLLGLFSAQRGEEAEAIDAFRRAEQLRPDDALASYYLGQTLLLLGQPEQAVEAFERATQRQPGRTDVLEIYRQLGRVHQRAQRTEEALEIWSRLESLFPNDPRVQEQIAATLVEEGNLEQALPRYEKLAEIARDDYRRTTFTIEAAELKIQLSRRTEGIADFEALLADLNPESWLHRDVRRRVEEVFLRSGDQDGLVAYYEKWIEANPEDVGAMARLARFLASSARVPEATEWMAKALKLAPSRTDLRKAFIDQLVDEQRYSEAVKQYSLLVKSAPGNQDFLRDWGRLVLKNKEVDQAERQREADRIWSKILALRGDDALTHAQVADLFRQANMPQRALALYEKAIQLAPSDPQYREYLGEYYHILKRPDDALKTWKAIAEGPRRSATNVARLAEVYNSFGYLDQAVVQIQQACELDSKDFNLLVKAAEYHGRAGQFDQALGFIDSADALAAGDEEQDTVIKQRIEIFQSSRRLDDEIELLTQSLRDDPSAEPGLWHTLARYLEAARRWADATEAIEKAITLEPGGVGPLTTAARIAELSGDFTLAAERNRTLAEVDRRWRSDHLMNVARLEAQLGRADEALQAGRDLIVSAPGNTDNYEFFAQLCFQLGKTEDGLNALRKAVRINPTEPQLIVSLASALSREFRSEEAIEVYWRAFEKTEEIDDKTGLTAKLAELYQQIGQFDQMLERLQRDRREEDKRREMTICVAQAHHTSGDYGTARMELESLLSEDTRDTNLLQQLSKLCESSADLDAAVEYQRQLVAIAPGHETEFRLAGLLQTRGDRDEANDIIVKLTGREEDPVRLLRSIDSLLRQGSHDSVIAIVDPLLSESRDNWELLYREAVAWAALEKTDEARDRFERILALTIPHETLGSAEKDRLQREQAKARSNNLRGIQTRVPTQTSPMDILGQASQIRRATGLEADNRYYGNSQLPPVWTPSVYGACRMAAFAWLMRIEQDASGDPAERPLEHEQGFALAEQIRSAAVKPDAERETIYDWMYIEQLRSNFGAIFQIAKRLASSGGKQEQRFFMNSLRMRGIEASPQRLTSGAAQQPKREPLSDEELELMMTCFGALSAESSEQAIASYGGQIARGSGGQVFIHVGGAWVQVAGLGSIGLGTVIEELKLAGREEQAEALLEQEISEANSPARLLSALNLLFEQEKFDRLPELYGRWVETASDAVAQLPNSVGSRRASSGSRSQVPNQLASAANFLMRWMGHIGAQEENAQVLEIMDRALDLATVESRKRRAQSHSKSRRSSPSYGSVTAFNLRYGKENIYARIDYPRPNRYIDNSTIMVLREAYEVLRRNDVVEDLPTRLRERLENAKPESQLYERLALASVLWWLEQHEEATELFAAASDELSDDPAYRLEIAQLYSIQGSFDEALEVVDGLAPRDQKLVQQRETMALNLAERLGDIDRARTAAERLFGLRLDTQTQMNLLEKMRRLGLSEMAEAVVARVQRRSGSQISSLSSLMTLYQGQGKTELADQVAHTILRRTSSPLTSMANTGRNPFRFNNRDGSARESALRVLQQTGTLKKLIQRLSSQLERSPESPRLYAELAEYYEASNQPEKVTELLKQAVEFHPKAMPLRYKLAKLYEQTGKLPEACDQYIEIVKKNPRWVADDLYQIRRTFERAQKSIDLVKAFQQINVKQLSRPHYAIDLVSNLLTGRGQQPSDEEMAIALDLFERLFVAFPNYQNQMISRIRQPELWKNERVFALGKRAIIPSPVIATSQPWFGLASIYSYGSGGRVNSMFDQMVSGIKGTEHADALRSAIENGIERSPDWKAGTAMLGMLDLSEGRREQGKNTLESLFEDDSALKDIPAQAAWIVGQQLEAFEDTRPMAIQLFEHAVKSGDNLQNQLQYSPIAMLTKLYTDSDRKEEARDLILKHVRTASYDHYDSQYASYQISTNKMWAAQQMLDIGYPVDSLLFYRQLLDDRQVLELASQWYGGGDRFATQAQDGFEKAISFLDESNADQAVEQLLQVDDADRQAATALDLMLAIPGLQEVSQKQMTCRLVDLLQELSDKGQLGKKIASRLSALQKEHPGDTSVVILRALFLLGAPQSDQTGNGGARDVATASVMEVLQELEQLLADQPLEEIAEGRRPNSRQRREALPYVPLWLIARECLKHEATEQLGHEFAQRAIQAARRQMGKEPIASILFDWGNIALEAGDRKQAEEKWSELLEIATETPSASKKPKKNKTGRYHGRELPRVGLHRAAPTRAPPPAVPLPHARQWVFRHAGLTTGSLAVTLATSLLQSETDSDQSQVAEKAQRVPPLTISQFRLVMVIAQKAAKNNLPELSRRAVEKSLRGGIPIADIPNSNNDSAFGSISSPVAMRNAAQSANSNAELETEVANSVRQIVSLWQDDANYAPRDVYRLLHPIVFPAHRPNEILIYPDNSRLESAQSSSLGVQLVRWAKDAKMLDDLAGRVDQRGKSPLAVVPSLVLQTHIALGSNDLDAAGRSLSELADQLESQPLPPRIQLGCHAAIACVEQEQLKDQAFRILKIHVDQRLRSTSASNSVTLGELTKRVNQYLAEKGKIEEVKKFYESYLIARQPYYSRYSGEGGLNAQRRDTAAIAQQAAEVGDVTTSADFLGRTVDIELSRYSQPNLGTTLALIQRHVSKLAPQERYAFWRRWSLPVEGRKTVRLLFQWVSPLDIPDMFLGPTDDAEQRHELRHVDFIDNLTELLEAAEACGKLDEVAQLAQQAHDDKLPGGQFLLPIAQVRQGKLEAARPHIRKLIATVAERTKVSRSQRREPVGDYLVYQACMQGAPEAADLYLADRLKLRFAFQDNAINKNPLILHADSNFVEQQLRQAGESLSPCGQQPFKHWIAKSAGGRFASSSVKPWWTTHEDQLVHVLGPASDFLYFRYPLSGDFSFSVDAFFGSWGEGAIGFNGVVAELQRYDYRPRIWSVSGHDSLYRSRAPTRDRALFGRMKVVARGDDIQFLLNGTVVYEEQRRTGSPWLLLWTEGGRITGFRNPHFEGDVQIPREVHLLSGETLDGWDSTLLANTQPRPRSLAEPARQPDPFGYNRTEPPEPDWQVQDGMLRGRALPDAGSTARSAIHYHRPLLAEETVRYEFYCEPGKTMIHPALGRVAFLLDPDGLRLHWMAHRTSKILYGVTEDNGIPATEAGAEVYPVQLKHGDWNQIAVSLDQDEQLHIELNGQPVLSWQLPPEVERQFGLFHHKRTSAQVRNVALSGPWPESLQDHVVPELLALRQQPPATHRRLAGDLLGDKLASKVAADVVAEARRLPAQEAYDYLTRWVLPSEDHASIRLYFQLTRRQPGDEPAQVSTAPTARLNCPAIELIQLASRQGRLEELALAAKDIAPHDELSERNRDVLLAMIASEQNDLPAARQLVAKIFGRLEGGLDAALPLKHRVAEFVAAWRLASHPELVQSAYDIAWTLRGQQRRNAVSQEFRKQTEALVGRIETVVWAQRVPEAAEKLTQWHAVAYDTPKARARGWQPSGWRYNRGSLQHLPGETWSQLYFQSPLQGDFEVVSFQTTHGYRETPLTYGMHGAIPTHDLKATTLLRRMHGSQTKTGKLDIPNWSDKAAEFRMVVQGNSLTTYCNGVKIDTTRFDSPPDPWLVLQSSMPGQTGRIHNLQILGQPRIPTEIDLIDMAGWAAWRADVYGEQFTTDLADNEGAAWYRSGDELRGQLASSPGSKSQESLLLYQRPMLEDGEIEFQSYRAQDEFAVHPSVGQTAFIVGDGTVGIHQLTDGRWQHIGEAPDNLTVLEPLNAFSLKQRDWNDFKLSLVGDRLTLWVNAVEVLHYELRQPPSLRQFGLFRYADQTQARVRQLLYRGQWPTQLPDVADQQLAYPAEGPFARPETDYSKIAGGSLDAGDENLPQHFQKQGISVLGPSSGISQAEQGVRIQLRDGGRWEAWPGLAMKPKIPGDFEATTTFRDLKMTPLEKGWGMGAMLQVELDDSAGTIVEFGRRMRNDGGNLLISARQHELPSGKRRYDQTVAHEPMEGGKLRLVRKGSQLHCLVAPAGRSFRVHESYTIGDSPVRRVQFQCKCADDIGTIDLVLEDFTVLIAE